MAQFTKSIRECMEIETPCDDQMFDEDFSELELIEFDVDVTFQTYTDESGKQVVEVDSYHAYRPSHIKDKTWGIVCEQLRTKSVQDAWEADAGEDL